MAAPVVSAVRVIAGLARGRKLKSPPEGSLRPTGDKVKGAIFSLLEAFAYKLGYERVVDDDGQERFAATQAWPRVLDLYAGSGALGIEALSRGAERVDFVESSPRARQIIAANLDIVGLRDRAAVHGLSAEKVLSTLSGSYDLILADPPYDDTNAERVLAEIADSPRVAGSTVLVWEHARHRQPPPRIGHLRLRRTREHGIAAVSLYAAEDLGPDRSTGRSRC